MYDYESRDIQKKAMKITGTCKIKSVLTHILGKLMRMDLTKDSVEIEAMGDAFNVKDTLST